MARADIEESFLHIPEPFRTAHKKSSFNRAETEGSKRVGCFYCERTFAPSEIREWIDEEQTPLCPNCGIDAVLPDTVPLDPAFLKEMNAYWF
jgi:NAD-dependent protein deacetylases, SIR2 family